MEWFDQFSHLNLLSSYLVIVASFLLLILYPARYYLYHARKFDKEYPTLSEGQFHWLIWPAIGASYFYEKLLGKVGPRFRDLFTWRSVTVTFFFSFLANTICIFLILTSIPSDLPPFDLQLIRILGLSHIVFIVFNYMGDLVSVNITRYVVSKIVAGKCNFLRYIATDVLGILLAYFITLAPSIFVTTYCWITGDELNQWVHTGLLGSSLIPFFLFIFATTNMPASFSIFAFVAVFSVTIPTAIYLFLMAFCYLGYRGYTFVLNRKKVSFVKGILQSGIKLANFLLFMASLLGALAILFQVF